MTSHAYGVSANLTCYKWPKIQTSLGIKVYCWPEMEQFIGPSGSQII